MKEWLDQEFARWRGVNRTKTILDFSAYLGVEYGALEHWMNGRRRPNRENVAKLAKTLGDTAYDIAGFARPGGNGNYDIDSRTLSLFVLGWKRFPPDLQRDLEELVSTATEEEAEEIFRDAVRTWLSRRNLTDAADDERDEESLAPAKGAKKQQARLQKRAVGT